MPRSGSFWRNLAVIGLAHVAVLMGVLRWSASATKPASSDIIWMEGVVGEATPVTANVSIPATTPPLPAELPLIAEEDAQVEADRDDATPLPSAAKSELELPPPTPAPSATPRPSPTLSPKASPKPKPEATARPTPKKMLIVKASPKPRVSPSEKKAAATVKVLAKAPPSSKSAEDSGGSGGSGSRGNGSGGASAYSWYSSMLHDRFFGEWVQPKSIAMSGAKMSAQVRIRIEPDGRISDFAIVRSSGNVVVDESIAAVEKRVKQVDPLPVGLASGPYEVTINFELNAES